MKKEEVYHGWICRDKDGNIASYAEKPERTTLNGEDFWFDAIGKDEHIWPRHFFPELKWKHAPKKVTITITID